MRLSAPAQDAEAPAVEKSTHVLTPRARVTLFVQIFLIEACCKWEHWKALSKNRKKEMMHLYIKERYACDAFELNFHTKNRGSVYADSRCKKPTTG